MKVAKKLRSALMVPIALAAGMALASVMVPSPATAVGWCEMCGGAGQCHATSLERSCECLLYDQWDDCSVCRSGWNCQI